MKFAQPAMPSSGGPGLSLSPRDPVAEPIARTLAGELDALFRFASSRLGGNAHAAEDAVQQAASIALDHRSPPTAPDEQQAWLRGILKNVIRRHWRSNSRRDTALEAAAIARSTCDVTTVLESGRLPPPAHPDRAHLVDRVFQAVASLSAQEQRLFYEFYRAGRSHECMARELGTSAKGVEARLYRMRSRLRAALAEDQRCEP